jgi:hypothetical protein
MSRKLIGLFVFSVGLVSGCGQTPTDSNIAAAPHGGNMVQLPDSVGSVEIVSNFASSAKGSSKAGARSRIFAYFYQLDGTPRLSPVPTDVKITLGNGTLITFAPESAEAGQFASPLGDYPDNLRGQIELVLDGKPVEAKFSFR